MECQPTDEQPIPFSFLNMGNTAWAPPAQQVCIFYAYTALQKKHRMSVIGTCLECACICSDLLPAQRNSKQVICHQSHWDL